jgi:hypothetical protein
MIQVEIRSSWRVITMYQFLPIMEIICSVATTNNVTRCHN